MAQPRTGKMVGLISPEVVNYPADKLIRAIGVQNFAFKWVNAHDLSSVAPPTHHPLLLKSIYITEKLTNFDKIVHTVT